MSRKKTKLNKSSHCAYSIHLHFVFITKYRRKLITKEMLVRLEEIFKQLCLKAKSELLEFGGENDHVHLLISLHPDKAQVGVERAPGVAARVCGRRGSE